MTMTSFYVDCEEREGILTFKAVQNSRSIVEWG